MSLFHTFPQLSVMEQQFLHQGFPIFLWLHTQEAEQPSQSIYSTMTVTSQIAVVALYTSDSPLLNSTVICS